MAAAKGLLALPASAWLLLNLAGVSSVAAAPLPAAPPPPAAASPTPPAASPAAAAVLPAPAPNEDPEKAPVEGPIVPGPRLAAAAAVDEMLRLSPEVRRSLSVVQQNRGVLQTAAGAFDRTFSIISSLNYNRLDLTPTKVESEVNRRLQLELPAQFLDQAASTIASNVPSNGSLLFSNCSTTNTVVEVQPGNGQQPFFICFNAQNQVVGFVLNNQTTGLGSVSVSAFDRLLLFNALNQSGFSISVDTQEVLDGFDDLLNFLSRQLHLAAASLRLQFFDLGAIPEEEDTIDFETDISYQWRFRNGISLTPMLSFQGTEDHYAGKILSPLFGDTLVPDLQTVTAGVTLDIPLGKGLGAVAADGPERAARENVKASQDLVAHTASEQALATVQAYLAVAAAEDHLRLELRAEESQRRIYDGTVQLAQGDEATGLDVKRTAGRLAQTRSDLAAARAALVQARLALQQVIGAPPGDATQAPLPSETLSDLLGADPPANLDPEVLVRQALANRRDLRASEEQAQADRYLAEAARANLKRQVDLALNASFNGINESVRDRWYDPRGYSAAVQAPIAGPSYSAVLHFSWPVQNNVARGQLVQADSTFAQAEIQKTDLKRQIRVSVLELLGTLRRSRLALELARQSMEYHDQTLAASIDRFKAGDLSVIDTLTTEGDATTARLAWIDALHSHLNLVAQLRFQLNALIAEGPGNTPPPAGAGRFKVPEDPSPASFHLLPLSAPLG